MPTTFIVKITKKNPAIVIIVPIWRRYIFEKVLPKKYQTGVDTKVIKKYKINSGPAQFTKPKYVETKIINKFAVKLLASRFKNVITAKGNIFLFC